MTTSPHGALANVMPQPWVVEMLRCPHTGDRLTPATAPDGTPVLLSVSACWMYPVVDRVPLLLPTHGIRLSDTD